MTTADLVIGQPFALFVEDSEPLARVFRDLAAKLGLSAVRVVESIDEARSEISTSHYERVISDWKVGGESGIDFLKELRSSDSGAQCMVLTGFVEDLGGREINRLRKSGIGVYDKEELDERLFRLLAMGEDAGAEVIPPHTSVETDNDVLAAMRLKSRILELERDEARGLVRSFALDLIEDLRKAPELGAGAVIGSSHARSVEELIEAVENLTPEGLALLEVDRAIRRRARQVRRRGWRFWR